MRDRHYFFVLVKSSLIKNSFFIGFELLSEKSECSGAELSKSYHSSIESCAKSCRNHSGLFAYGKKPHRCKNGRCNCICEIVVEQTGRCDQVSNVNYDLYRYIESSDNATLYLPGKLNFVSKKSLV